MSELTKRGEEDRRREDEKMTGEQVAAHAAPPGGTNTTRDKGVAPVSDDNARHDDTDKPRK
ncbi:MAG TPA: hypothetical protein VD866_33175 [Urbifossiella sp.]|nr:hypothetical protein [Urbifossiella sp.]